MQFNRVAAFPARSSTSTTNSSSAMVAALLVERKDPKDYPHSFNYDWYLVAVAADGTQFQSRPIHSTEPNHHSSSPSTWFDGVR